MKLLNSQSQWERKDPVQPAANAVDAKRLGADLAGARIGREIA
jgi:hypothetical protein